MTHALPTHARAYWKFQWNNRRMCLSDRVGNPSRFKINYHDGDCYGDFWGDVEPCLENPDITRFNVDHLEFSGIAINYSKASLTVVTRICNRGGRAGQGEIWKVTSRHSRNPDCPVNPRTQRGGRKEKVARLTPRTKPRALPEFRIPAFRRSTSWNTTVRRLIWRRAWNNIRTGSRRVCYLLSGDDRDEMSSK